MSALMNVVIQEEIDEVVLGMDALVIVLREKLQMILDKQDTGIRDKEGDPIMSLRAFSRHIGNEGGYAYLSGFAKNNAMPCMVILNKVANGFGVKYQVTNF